MKVRVAHVINIESVVQKCHVDYSILLINLHVIIMMFPRVNIIRVKITRNEVKAWKVLDDVERHEIGNLLFVILSIILSVILSIICRINVCGYLMHEAIIS